MRKMLKGVGIVIFFLGFVLSDSSFADGLLNGNSTGFEEIYTVDSYGSTTKKDIFGWDETPWLYLNLPGSGSGMSVSWSWWVSPTNDVYYNGTLTTQDEVWLSLNNWNSVREVGNWTINSAYFYPTGEGGTGTAAFAVAPEPIGGILFLVGGVSLAVARLRKRG